MLFTLNFKVMKKFMHLYSVSDKYYLFKRLLIMKLTLLFLLIFNICAFADVYSQTKISLNVKDADLKQVLQTIERNSSYRFVYSERKTPTDKKVTINATNKNVTEVLDEILGNLNLIYKDQGNNLLAISTPDKMAEYLAEQQAAFKVTGIVTDISTGETLIGATIRVKGANITTNVDVGGKFSIEVPNANSILVVNYIGYTELEVPVEGKTVLDIKMSKLTTNLDEVVVSGFGLTAKRATVTGSIATVTADELAHTRAVSSSGALVGRIAGLTFRQNTGRPGFSPDIQIRNFGQALLVIDGVIRQDPPSNTNSSFNNLDFNDIESISILKDASAAIYGLLAANGVIVITTKKGQRGQKPTISYNGYFGEQEVKTFNQPADIKTYIIGIVQSETYRNVADASRTISRAEYDLYMNPTDEKHQGFDWYKYIYIPAGQNYHSASISGGSENMDYYVSGGALAQHSMFRNFGSGFSRNNGQINVNANISKRVKVGISVNGRRDNTNSAPSMSDDYDFLVDAAFSNLPTFRPYANNNPLYPAQSAPIDQQRSYSLVNYGAIGTENTTRNSFQTNANIEISLFTGLKARAQVGYSYVNSTDHRHRKSPIFYTYDATTDNYNVVQPVSNSRIVWETVQSTQNTSTNFQLDYKKSIGKHNFQAVVGVEATTFFNPRIDVQGQPAANGISYIPNIGTINSFTDDISNKTTRQGYLSRLNYDYDGKYILELNGRYDGSGNYTPSNRWGFFPSASVGYRISQEDWWKKSAIFGKINELKIRASYGILGNLLGSNAAYAEGYNYSQGSALYDGNVVVTTQARGLPAAYQTWGRTQSLNIGIDVTLLKNRLSATVDVFERIQTGLLADRNILVPNLMGIDIGDENLNSNINRGIDGSVNWKDKIGAVNYFVGGNFAISRVVTGFRYNPQFSSEWSKYRDPNNVTGRWQGGANHYEAIGQFQTWEQITNYPIDQDGAGNKNLRPGDYIYRDLNGDGVINGNDQTLLTYRVNAGNPQLSFGFNIGGSYKGFDIRADFAGGSLFTYEQSGYMRTWGNNLNTSQYLADNSTWYKDIWDKNSGFNIGKFPLLIQGNTETNATQASTAWDTNVTYAKLRNLEIGYTFPYSIMKKVGVSNLRIYVSGQNIANISNVKGGIDPETTTSGGTAYPNPRILTAGLSVKF
jgi:TonB-linked SusC/RagA family outer membrane protein